MHVLRAGLVTFFVICAGLFLSGCGSNKKSDRKVSPDSGIGADKGSMGAITESGTVVDQTLLDQLIAHFQFTSTMDEEIIDFFRYDLGTLSAWKESGRASELERLKKLYDISTVNASTLSQWLKDRLTYIYPDDGASLQFAFIVPAENRVYELSINSSSDEGVAASNIGGGLYATYLDFASRGVEGLLLNFNKVYLPFLSPRTGVMQIGPNFFDEDDNLKVSDSTGQSFRVVKSLYRLSVIFHEARHSDGNQAAGTLSFAHLICPDDGSVGPEYVGKPACDGQANGAYNVGAQILTSLEGICDGVCKASHLDVIEAIYLDALSRILVDDIEANYGDAAPEPLLDVIDTRTFEFIPE